jgi:benzil reductase ((S)-benzoin forming)
MDVFYITGASSGIGEAIAELLLENTNNMVIGIARSRTIQHDRYKHHYIDLSQPWTDKIFKASSFNADKVVLINNAGSIGPIKPLGQHEEEEIKENYFLNIAAPSILCKQFISCFENSKSNCIILNISSGAGKQAIHSWSTYCASKSAIDMFSHALQLEYPSFKVFSIAPGIVDTAMQDEIREAKKSDFPDVDRFISYKEEGELVSAELVAEKYVHFLNDCSKRKEVLYSIRDL